MWPGPYGEWGSRKYLLASLDQSLSRWGSSMSTSSTRTASIPRPARGDDGALAATISQGKALYVGISSYSLRRPARPRRSSAISACASSFTSRLTRSSTVGSRPSFWTRSATSASAASASRRSPRAAHRSLSRRNPGGVAREPARLDVTGPAQRGDDGQGTRLERDRRASRPDTCRARPCLDAPRPADDLDTGRGEQHRAARAEPGALQKPDFTAVELEEIDRYASDSGINIWAASSEN